MAYKLLLDSKILLLIPLYCSLLLVGCNTSEMIQDQIENTVQNSKIEDASLTNDGNLLEGESRTNPIIISYKNASSNVQISLDPNKDEFYLDLKGIAPSEKDSIIIVDSTLINNRARDIQTLLSSYRKAQDLFYLGEYRDALAEVDKTLEIQETADAYALKGTIFFMMENPTAARANWNKAVQMDPNIPVPSIPELEVLINEIREVNGQ
jgi:tetratricopeptide (TPR) repeat protein